MFESSSTALWLDRVLSTNASDAMAEADSTANLPPSDADVQSIRDVIGTPVILGCVLLSVAMIFFAIAIHNEWIGDLAPRAANRPKAVMKNAILHGFDQKYRNKIYIYPFAWILWAYRLTYKQCIVGIPGTGTRKNGWEGPLLKTNLDGIILLKFHALLFKVGVLMAALCLLVILPVNMTASCDPELFGVGTCAQHANRSEFVQTTIANIPDKIYNDNENVTLGGSINVNEIVQAAIGKAPTSTVVKSNTTAAATTSNVSSIGEGAITAMETVNNNTSNSTDPDEEKRNRLRAMAWVPDQTWRVAVTACCCVVMYIYTMYLLWMEWIENVALRRAFFLEASHYGQRMIELNKFDLDFVKKKKKDDDYGARISAVYSQENNNDYARRDDSTNLPPYLTHPEIRETPPSVGLYSVLYQLPNSMVTYDTDGATSVERQLVATTKFFDEVVPPQPGFSSSVAAVTMIPNAKLVANAWRKWKSVEKKLQALRKIRKLLAEKDTLKSDPLKNSVNEDEEQPFQGAAAAKDETEANIDGLTKVHSQESDGKIEALPYEKPKEVFKYEDFDVKVYARSLGFSDEVDKVSDFVDGMGIEEFNVFAVVCALMEGGPGFGKKVLNFYSVEALKEEETQLLEELDDAHQELIDARNDVVAEEDDTEVVSSPGTNGKEISPMGKSMKNLDREQDEWRVSENELDEALEILESTSENRTNTNNSILKCLCLTTFFKRVFVGPEIVEFDPKYYGMDAENHARAFTTDVGHPSYAVITFTSRHAAIIARQCLADGVAMNNWMQVNDLPIFPLADAPANMWLYPKGYMRPVTPTIPYSSKKIRRWAVFIFLVVFIATYSQLIFLLNNFLWSPDLYIGWSGLSEETLSNILPTLSGATTSMIFSICPQIFKFVANKEGHATSMDSAEQRAMIYFWYFYIIVRYVAQVLAASLFIDFLRGENTDSVEDIVTGAVEDLALQAPTILGPVALNWIILASTFNWPFVYFLQMNNFLTSWFRLEFFNRVLKGGGPGTDVSYRIYVDNGYVFSCLTTLAPLCPLVGPFALLYYVILSPMLRWLIVFGYRPKFDSGGDKWPKLHHMVITSLLLGQLVTGASFILKGNIYAGIVIVACTIPTLLFNSIVLEKFLRPFRDASLRYTGKIYNTRNAKDETEDPWQAREEFRRWLVDCHKASYLPTCLSGGERNLLTAEPAMVVPKIVQPKEEIIGSADLEKQNSNMRNLFQRQTAQKGGIMRRQRFGI